MNKFLFSALVLLLAGCCKDDSAKINKSSDEVSVSEIIEIEEIGMNSSAQKRFLEVLSADRVSFSFDRSDLSAHDKEFLDKVAKYLADNSSLKIEVQGNCDIRGSANYNMALGDKRAIAAADYLKSKGVSENRMNTVSFGSRVLVEGDTEEAYAKNRVSIILIKK